MKEKVVLAYSGGLDTTTLIPWLKENFNYDVICCCAKHDLLPLVQSVESGFSAILSGAWEANRDGDAFRLRFGEDGACTLEEARQGSRVTSTGALTVLGMGDGGLLCACSLTQPDGNELTAIWSIEPSFGSLQLCAFSGENVLDIGADALRFEPAQE